MEWKSSGIDAEVAISALSRAIADPGSIPGASTANPRRKLGFRQFCQDLGFALGAPWVGARTHARQSAGSLSARGNASTRNAPNRSALVGQSPGHVADSQSQSD
jgi:hypothetical protein